MTRSLRPGLLFGLCALGVAILFVIGPNPWLWVIRAVAGYGLALALCISVAREHREGSWLRFAWNALAVNALASIARHIADTPLWDLASPGYSSSVEIALIRQTAIVIGLGALLAGVAAMVWAFHSMGVGLSPGRVDIFAIVAVFAILATIFHFREGLAEARSASFMARYLQQLGLILLAASAACSILVYRLARQMSGGRLAVSMLYLVIYTALRCVLVCISLFPNVRALTQPVTVPLDFTVPWLFALAAAYRSGIARHGAAQIPESSPVSPLLQRNLQQTFPAS